MPAEPIRVLIADDEPLGRSKLKTFLKRSREVEVVAECGDGVAAVEKITELRPDIVFLDVQMPLLDGLGVVAAIGPTAMPVTVFVTAYDQFAVKAFEVRALDYLLKPFDAERFEIALQRARGAVSLRRSGEYEARLRALLAGAPDAVPHTNRLLVKTGSEYVFVTAADVDWVEAADNYVTLHMGERRYMLRETVARMEQRLDPRQFLRIRHSAIVNIERIQAIRPWSGSEYQIVVRNGPTLLSSRRYRDRIREMMSA